MTPDKMADIAALIAKLRAKWPAENKARFGDINPNGPQAATALTELLAEREETRARVAKLERAGGALIADVRARYPGEKLRCPYMITLDAALKEPTNG